MWQDMPVSLRLPFVFSFAMAMLLAITTITTAANALTTKTLAQGLNALVPLSLCFLTIGMLCSAIAQQNRRIVELERRLTEIASKSNEESNTTN